MNVPSEEDLMTELHSLIPLLDRENSIFRSLELDTLAFRRLSIILVGAFDKKWSSFNRAKKLDKKLNNKIKNSLKDDSAQFNRGRAIPRKNRNKPQGCYHR